MIYRNYYYSDYLYHHGIKGQKWGVRRTPAQLGNLVGKVGTATAKGVAKVGLATGKATAKVGRTAGGAAARTIKNRHDDRVMRNQLAKAAKNYRKGKLDRLTDDELKRLADRENKKTQIVQNIKQRKEMTMNPGKKFAKDMAKSAVNGFEKGVEAGVKARTLKYISNYGENKGKDDKSSSDSSKKIKQWAATKAKVKLSSIGKNPAAKEGNATRFNKKFGDIKVESLGKGAPTLKDTDEEGKK